MKVTHVHNCVISTFCWEDSEGSLHSFAAADCQSRCVENRIVKPYQ